MSHTCMHTYVHTHTWIHANLGFDCLPVEQHAGILHGCAVMGSSIGPSGLYNGKQLCNGPGHLWWQSNPQDVCSTLRQRKQSEGILLAQPLLLLSSLLGLASHNLPDPADPWMLLCTQIMRPAHHWAGGPEHHPMRRLRRQQCAPSQSLLTT